MLILLGEDEKESGDSAKDESEQLDHAELLAGHFADEPVDILRIQTEDRLADVAGQVEPGDDRVLVPADLLLQEDPDARQDLFADDLPDELVLQEFQQLPGEVVAQSSERIADFGVPFQRRYIRLKFRRKQVSIQA